MSQVMSGSACVGERVSGEIRAAAAAAAAMCVTQ